MAHRLAIILCLILIANQSEGYIVDGVNGDDSNSGENVDDAFKTIARCVQSLRDQPIVLLIEGCKFAFKSCVYLRCIQCHILGDLTGCGTGNEEKLSSSQAE